MKLACEGCNWTTEADTADELHAAMMAHGDDAHSGHSDGKSPEEVQAMKQMMDAHVRQMIIDQN
jgi:predicted small metal-binding protein